MTTAMKLHPIFAECVAKEWLGTRYSIETTWVAGGWLYATDSRICVRCKTDEPDSIDPHADTNLARGYPPVAALFVGKWHDTPLKLPAEVKCEESKCRDCEGTGTVTLCSECECTGRDCECKSKANRTSFPCEECDHGIVRTWPSIDFGKVALGGRYVAILIRHNCRAFAWKGKNAANKPVRFSFDGGEGLLMPVSLPTAKDAGVDVVEVPQ